VLPFASGAGLPSDLEDALEQEAMKEAEKGAALAHSVGFVATALVESGIPVWSGIVQVADDHDASVIVMGSPLRPRELPDLIVGDAGIAKVEPTEHPSDVDVQEQGIRAASGTGQREVGGVRATPVSRINSRLASSPGACLNVSRSVVLMTVSARASS
jgi:hypothetical protein